MEIINCAFCGTEMEVEEKCNYKLSFCTKLCAINYLIEDRNDEKESIEEDD